MAVENNESSNNGSGSNDGGISMKERLSEMVELVGNVGGLVVGVESQRDTNTDHLIGAGKCSCGIV